MSQRRGMQEIPVDYQPVPRPGEVDASCCRRPNCVAREERRSCTHGYIIPIFILFVLVLIVLLLPWETFHRNEDANQAVESPLPCQLQLVESLPIGLNYTRDSPRFLSTFEAWQLLLAKAKTGIDIAAPYWTLRGVDFNESSSHQGEQLFQRLLSNGDSGKHKLRLRIALDRSQQSHWQADAKIMANYGAAEVVGLKLLQSKLWLVDDQHFYVGSANMDWRSLTQVKELGVLATHCPHLTRDMAKIFKSYWYLDGNDLPIHWPWTYHTHFNLQQPMLLNVNTNYTMRAFVSSSPPVLVATGRTKDLDAILFTIDKASEFVHIALRDYYPLLRYENQMLYWPPIDNALRQAAVERGVAIRMLISWWKHSEPSEDHFLRSLQALHQLRPEVDIQIRRFVVPSNEQQDRIPYSRVNHNSYMVTENRAYIGTSTWSGEYFNYSAGVGLNVMDLPDQNNTLRLDLLSLFYRDWFSAYALPLKHNLQL